MKFGIWRTRYGMRGFFEGWVFIDGKPAVFNSEDNAAEYMHTITADGKADRISDNITI